MTFVPQSDGEQCVYYLASFEDRFRNRINARYPSHGKLSLLVDVFFREFQFHYNPSNERLWFFGDYVDNFVTYHYDQTDAGNLSRVTTPKIKHWNNPFPDGRTESYGYYPENKNHYLKWIQDAYGNDKNLTEKLISLDYHPDPAFEGHVTKQEYASNSFIFEPGSNSLKYFDREGFERNIAFNSSTNGFAQLPSSITFSRDNSNVTFSYEYNSQGELSRKIFPLGNSIEYTYDENALDQRDKGNLLKKRFVPDGSRPTFVTRSVGIYDSNVDPVIESVSEIKETYEYEPGLQEVSKKTDALDRDTIFLYNSGILKKISYPKVTRGGISQREQFREKSFEWNNWGQLIKEVDPNGVVTRYHYHNIRDPTGNGTLLPISNHFIPGAYLARIEKDFYDTSVRRASHLSPIRTTTEEFFYDERGYLSKQRDGKGNFSEVEFNEVGEIQLLKGAEGETTKHTYDANGRETKTEYVISDLNFPAGIRSTTKNLNEEKEYDREGNIKSLIIDKGGLSLTTTWDYDKNDRITFVHSPKANASPVGHDGKNSKIGYHYDDGGKLRLIIEGEGSQKTTVTEFDYDDNGNLVTETTYKKYPQEPSGVKQLVYDGFDRLITEGGFVSETQYHLDDIGNKTKSIVIGTVDGDLQHKEILQEITNYYDEADRQIICKKAAFELRPNPTGSGFNRVSIANGAQTKKIAYDAAGFPIKTTDEFGVSTTMEIDGHGKPTHIVDDFGNELSFSFDGNDNPEVISINEPLLGLTKITNIYDKSDRRVSQITQKEGTTVTQNYFDSMDRLRIVEDELGNRVETVYDGAGRIVRKIFRLYQNGRRLNPGGPDNPVIISPFMKYVYDENDNLLESYNMDGNLIEKLEYDNRDYLIKRTLPDDIYSDATTNRNDNPGEEFYEYEYRDDGLLDSISDPMQHLIKHEYDDAGNLNRRTVKLQPFFSWSNKRNYRTNFQMGWNGSFSRMLG